MKYLLLLTLLFSFNANALVGSSTKQIFDLTNPSGADLESAVQDVSERNGYSIHCDLTGTLQLTSSIYVSNQKIIDPTVTQKFTLMSGSTLVVTTAGIMYDVTISNVGYVKLKLGTFSGLGTAKCYITTKDI